MVVVVGSESIGMGVKMKCIVETTEVMLYKLSNFIVRANQTVIHMQVARQSIQFKLWRCVKYNIECNRTNCHKNNQTVTGQPF